MINYPGSPGTTGNPLDYATSPWLDVTTGLSWLWVVRAGGTGKWGRAPAGGVGTLTNAFTSSESTPSNENLPWFDPSDGTLSIWSPENDAWIVTSGSGNDGEDGEDLTSTAQVVTISTATHTLVTANVDKYLRFTALTAKTVTIPVAIGTFLPTVGNLLTLRNAADSNLTITQAVGVVVNFYSGGLTIAPQTSAQLIYVSANTWDLL